ncbi:hypothetical protein FSP39_013142 [Pinctada imbricata]|uniref:Integrase catalytic domain-containing protein n=1 Tax=Pinctada imbricata TaxID=66713 RepID=A0AA88YVX7_PINIB|nr:hypothetical protein FSP39_013142 [Pinctada imbricata]
MMKSQFARHGIPDKVKSDNGPPFNSREFAEFSKSYEFEHITSSPRYAQSNGKAEISVKIAKRLIHKCAMDGKDPYLALLDLRNTPTQGIGYSPAQRMFGRRTKTLLPVAEHLLKPRYAVRTQEKLYEWKERQTQYYNRGAKELKALSEGDEPFRPEQETPDSEPLTEQPHLHDDPVTPVVSKESNQDPPEQDLCIGKPAFVQPAKPVSVPPDKAQIRTCSGRVIVKPQCYLDK